MPMPQTASKERIRDWWADAPMTYGERHGGTQFVRPDGSIEVVEIGSRRFFELADERFLSWNTPLHTETGPFGAIFPYAQMQGRRVLEVGCGMGCMAMNWAQRGAEMTASDLNPISIAQTRRRFELFGLAGDIRQADAEALPFADNSFDFVYSWGVLHHTPDTAKAIEEIRRVLKPGARAGVMLYHRHSILFMLTVAYQEGWVNSRTTVSRSARPCQPLWRRRARRGKPAHLAGHAARGSTGTVSFLSGACHPRFGDRHSTHSVRLGAASG